MRLNQYIAQSLGIGRRKADTIIQGGDVTVNGQPAQLGQRVSGEDKVMVNSEVLRTPTEKKLIALHKPSGFVTSKRGQGSATIYDLLPEELSRLKPIGRLDKNSSGLLLLSNDGALIERLSHPRYQKEKRYEVSLNQPLAKNDFLHITADGVVIDTKQPSKLTLTAQCQPHKASTSQNNDFQPNCQHWLVRMHEGRNRQIRKTFRAIGYKVTRLHRTSVGPFVLQELPEGSYREIASRESSDTVLV